jgi:hypothetical protein
MPSQIEERRLRISNAFFLFHLIGANYNYNLQVKDKQQWIPHPP